MSDWQLVDSSFCGSGDGDDEPERSVSRQSVSRTKAELSMDDWSDMQDDEADVSSLPGQGSSTQRRVLRDLREIRLMLDSFIVSDCDFGGGTRIWLRVGWPVKLLELNDEQCAAWSAQAACLALAQSAVQALTAALVCGTGVWTTAGT